jgi:hypothetical protein
MATLARSGTPAPATTASGESIAARTRARTHRVAQAGRWGLARLSRLITAGVVALILIGIALVLLDGNRDNMIVDGLLDAANWLARPFEDMFTLDGHEETIAVNYGVAAFVYALAGGLFVRVVRPR